MIKTRWKEYIMRSLFCVIIIFLVSFTFNLSVSGEIEKEHLEDENDNEKIPLISELLEDMSIGTASSSQAFTETTTTTTDTTTETIGTENYMPADVSLSDTSLQTDIAGTSTANISNETETTTISPATLTTTDIVVTGTTASLPATNTQATTSVLDAGTSTATVATSTITISTSTTTATLTTKEQGTPTLTGTGIIFTPTAYRLDKKTGFESDFIIAYYIGDMWRRLSDRGIEFIDPIEFLFFSLDMRYSFLKEKGYLPSLAGGFNGSIVLKGRASTVENVGTVIEKGTKRFGYRYLVASKSFKKNNYHIGLLIGKIDSIFNAIKGMDIKGNTLLLRRNQLEDSNALFLAFDTTICKRQIGLELIYPSKGHFLLNTSINQFLPFDFAIMKMPDGFSLIGYFGIRLPIYPYQK